jgi:hypothetical protein
MRFVVIFTAGPVRHMSVRAGALMRETTNKDGQRPCEPATSMFAWAVASMSGWPGRVSAGQHYVQHRMEALRRDGAVRAWLQAPGDDAGESPEQLRRMGIAADRIMSRIDTSGIS